MNLKVIAQYCKLIVFFLMLSGCATKRDIQFTLIIEAEKNINPDHLDMSAPTMIRLFELTTSETFVKRDFWSLYDDTEGALGSDLVNQGKWVIKPGDTLKYHLVVDSGSRYLGVMAEFRDIEKAQWKLVIPIASSKKTYRVKMDGLNMVRR